nr:PREDICTED: olfactory receptor 1019-like [Struthio camelus australis]
MAKGALTAVTEFILLGFTDSSKTQVILFVVFLLIYLLILVRNLGVIILLKIDSQLHSPMYFFLSNLAFLYVSCSTVIAPRTLMTFAAKTKAISFTDCALQFFFFCIAASCESCELGVMAYDRFTAIGNPLLYLALMSKEFCVYMYGRITPCTSTDWVHLLVLGSYITGLVNAIVQTIFIFDLFYYDSDIINHFFCDVSPLQKHSCSDTHTTAIIHFIFHCHSIALCEDQHKEVWQVGDRLITHLSLNFPPLELV